MDTLSQSFESMAQRFKEGIRDPWNLFLPTKHSRFESMVLVGQHINGDYLHVQENYLGNIVYHADKKMALFISEDKNCKELSGLLTRIEDSHSGELFTLRPFLPGKPETPSSMAFITIGSVSRNTRELAKGRYPALIERKVYGNIFALQGISRDRWREMTENFNRWLPPNKS